MADEKSEKSIVGFTAGSFDLCHAGHLLMFKEISKQCDYLIVGLQSDPSIDRPSKHKPVETIEERIIRLQACRYVDKIIVYDTEADLYKILQKEPIDVRFLGADWEGKEFTGWDLPIKVVFNSRDHQYSSSNLRERVKQSDY